MTTDNRTNEPTPEQIEAAAQAVREVDARAGLIADVDLPMYRARAALAAAAGAAPQAEIEPMYSMVSRQWSGSCPCVRAEQVDPECEWHGRPEFRIGGEFHHDSPGVEIVTKAARVLHVATCCRLSAGSKHQEPQNEDMFTAGVVLNSVPLAAPVQPSSTVDEAALIREAKAEALEEFAEAQETWCVRGRAEQVISRGAIRDALRARATEYREGSET